MKKLVLKIIAQTLSIGIFVTVFLGALFITYGYRYDFEENQVIETSVVDVCLLPKKAELYVDGELYDTRSCVKITGIDVGAHDIEVRKEGYYSWKTSVFLDREKAKVFPQILLKYLSPHLLLPRREQIPPQEHC